MWKDLQRVLAHLLRWSRKGASERRKTRERARFWAEVREGQREAEAQARD